MCPKCYNRGKIYSIDGSLTIVKACDCEVAKEQQNSHAERMDKLKRELEQKLLEL